MRITIREIEDGVNLPEPKGGANRRENREQTVEESRGRSKSELRETVDQLELGQSFRVPGYSVEKAKKVGVVLRNANRALKGTGTKLIKRRQGRDIRVWKAPVY